MRFMVEKNYKAHIASRSAPCSWEGDGWVGLFLGFVAGEGLAVIAELAGRPEDATCDHV